MDTLLYPVVLIIAVLVVTHRVRDVTVRFGPTNKRKR
jgi:hypothetical protein